MIIDFHTHIFPDKIAQRTVALLAEKGNMPPYSDGTADGLLAKMQETGVDVSVSLPVLTSPHQFDSVNRFAKEINETFCNTARRIISFGGIHPACDGIDEKMKFLRDEGFLGVKIHPDYQDTFIDSDGYTEIMECARKYDLIVVTHSGPDAAYLDREPKCPPERLLKLIRRVPHKKFVLAHFGSNEQYDKTYELLAGLDVYFDTSLVLPKIPGHVFKKILKKHGDDKILFATDSPWNDISEDKKIIESFDLPENTKQKILYENAASLLGIR